MKKQIIYHISDTHGYHNLLENEKVDIIVHSGDCSNYRDPYTNEKEVREFIEWYKDYPAKYKIYNAGNHCTSIESKLIRKEDFEKEGIIYLEHESIEIEGINIFATPYTPSFGNWSFMKNRGTIDRTWQTIPSNIDIFVSHGPPKGKLDLSYNREGELEFCGCSSLDKHIINRIKPKLVCFGHIHSMKGVINAGILYQEGIYYSNGSVVTDNKFGSLTSNGNIFEIDENKNVKIIK